MGDKKILLKLKAERLKVKKHHKIARASSSIKSTKKIKMKK